MIAIQFPSASHTLRLLGAAFALLALPQPAAAANCQAAPPTKTDYYLRGTLNNWQANDKERFAWICDRYELVVPINGEHRFKVADENWSARGGDFGAEPPEGSYVLPFDGTRKVLTAVGAPMSAKFAGVYRFTLRAGARTELSASACPKMPDITPTLFLRGTPNNWTTLEEFQFQYSCDAYYLNVKLSGAHSFKIADSAWTPATTYGAPPTAGAGRIEGVSPQLIAKRGSDSGGNQDVSYVFSGEHTIRLDVNAAGGPALSVGPKSFADAKAKSIDNEVALSLKHDSRDIELRQPFGAVPAGTPVRIGVLAKAGVESMTLVVESRRLEGNQEVLEYAPVTRLEMQRSKQGALERFGAVHLFEKIGVYGYWFEAKIGGKTYVYQNNTDAVFWTREKGSGGVGVVSEPPAKASNTRRFRVAVYQPNIQVPAWAKDAVYYYVFPERFRNGNPKNDPVPGKTKYHQHTVELHKKWNELPFKPGSGDGSDAFFNNDFFGGDLQGIIDKLDEIKDLGANTLFMTPIFTGASNHKYDAGDYLTVDPHFGTNADFGRLSREAKKRGIRVMIDTSLNHTGADSPYFDRFGNFGDKATPLNKRGAFADGKINPKSPYASWYTFDPTQTEPDKQYKGWVGVSDLPELNKNAPAWREFAYRAPGSVTRTWLKRGASGWRMDVAPWVPDDFWREWRSAVKATAPNAMTVAETWFDASKHLLGDMFDSTMNYIFRNAVLEMANGANVQEMYANLEHIREQYPPQAHFALMNLLSTHDQARSLHHLGWHDDKTSPEKIKEAKQRFLMAITFQMAYPGSPAIYYGDEVGVTGGDDPYNRATYPWADLGGKPDMELRAHFKALTKMRAQHPVLRHGQLFAPLHMDATTLILQRRLCAANGRKCRHALIAVNNAKEQRNLVFDATPHGLPRHWNAVYPAPTSSSIRQLPLSAARGAPTQMSATLAPLSVQVWVDEAPAR